MENICNKKCKLFLILFAVFIITYVLNLWAYPLVDLDETRYVTMSREMFQSRDFLTLYINEEYFFEKPPLFFWIENLSFMLFGGNINEFTARLPITLLSLLPLGFLFKISEKVKDEKFAFVNCAILLTFIEYIVITKIAILDSVLTSFVTCSVFSYFFTFFVEEKNKKYFWWLTYIFSGLAVLAKGIPGVAIPAIIIFFGTIIFKTYKETIKNFPLGIILFLLITLPWHIVMLNKYGSLFFDEYIIKHHIARFLGSDVINRSEPAWFYLAVLVWGLCPWLFSIVIKFIEKIKNKTLSIKYDDVKYKNFIILNLLAVCSIFLFFTSSGTKLITYIVPIYPFFACITGTIWYEYIYENKKSNAAKYSLHIINTILAITLIGAPFMSLFLPADIYTRLRAIQFSSIIIISIYLIISIISIKKDKRFNQFVSLVFFFAFLFCIVAPMGFMVDYSFGQDDLMNFAKYAKENNCTISTYKTGKKYSLNYYSGIKKIDYQIEENEEWLKNELKKQNNLLIVRNKDIDSLPFKVNVNKHGYKYSAIEQ